MNAGGPARKGASGATGKASAFRKADTRQRARQVATEVGQRVLKLLLKDPLSTLLLAGSILLTVLFFSLLNSTKPESPGVRVPLKDAPGVLVHVPPQPVLVQRVILAPVGNIKQKPDGRIVAGSDFASGGGDTSREAGESLLKTMSSVSANSGNQFRA